MAEKTPGTFALSVQACSSDDRHPRPGLRKGDVATIVEHLPGKNGEDDYALEVFNAIGETIGVIMAPESAVEPLTADKIPSVRPLAKTG